MKYIRTKDGYVLKIKCKQKRPNGEYDTWYVCKHGSLLYNHDKDKIAMESDTIEELCDVYVCDKLIFYSKKQLSHYCYMPAKEIYGAIWTDKGLIYVAKMNNKGELELL